MNMKRIIAVLPLVACMVLPIACSSDKRAKVTGKVTYAGNAPFTGGNIRFVSVKDPNKVGAGLIKADGTYEVPDAPLGECKVVIDNTHMDPSAKKTGGMPMVPGKGGMGGNKAPNDTKKKMGDAAQGADVAEGMNAGKADLSGTKYIKIDPAFTKDESTTLKATVTAGDNTHNFDVK